MTPNEIFDYRLTWCPHKSHKVFVHSDLQRRCLEWCQSNIEPQFWYFAKYTDVYEHGFYFEKQQDAERFRGEMSNGS